MPSPDNHPATIEGGCLCGAIRYKLHFPYGSPWPPAPHDCQCTQCRKWTGALICPWIGVKPTQITWPQSSDPENPTSKPKGLKTFAQYESSPGVYRGFCNKCASPFIWQCDKEPDEVGITTGSIDEDLLVGKTEGCDGADRGRSGIETGKALAEPIEGHLWFENAIRGVTDSVTVGKKYAQGMEGSVIE